MSNGSAEKIIADALENRACFEEVTVEAETQKSVNILFDLLESLSEEQLEQLRENIAQHAERHQKRRERLQDAEMIP